MTIPLLRSKHFLPPTKPARELRWERIAANCRAAKPQRTPQLGAAQGPRTPLGSQLVAEALAQQPGDLRKVAQHLKRALTTVLRNIFSAVENSPLMMWRCHFTRRIDLALRMHDGNLEAAAHELNMPAEQIRRLIARAAMGSTLARWQPARVKKYRGALPKIPTNDLVTLLEQHDWNIEAVRRELYTRVPPIFLTAQAIRARTNMHRPPR